METPRLLPWTDSGLTSALDEQRVTAREQLKAAWQLHVERVEEQLAAGWKDQIDRVIEDRFTELAAHVEEEFRREVSSRVASESDALRRQTAEQINQAARRLRQCETGDELHAALLDSAGAFCSRAILFAIDGEVLRCAGVFGTNEGTTNSLSAAEVPLSASPAARNAVESLDTVVSQRTAGELSETLALLLGCDAGRQSYFFPIVSRGKALGLLYADGDDPAPNTAALELLASVAGSSIDLHAAAGAAQTARLQAVLPEWVELPPEEKEAHVRAQRFARVQVAEMRLYKSREVRAGRAASNLYGELKKEIDAGREAFRVQFLVPCPSMIDYFHVELIRTLANDEAALLGPEYPGPLV